MNRYPPPLEVRSGNALAMKAFAMKRRLGLALFLLCFTGFPVSAAELARIPGAALVESDSNDGDSFVVDAGGRRLHLRLYYVDCLETAAGSNSEVDRIIEQQRHFGLADPRAVLEYGEAAARFTKQALSEPFTVHTGYAMAPGRSAMGRYYAFVETHDGRDLGGLLVAHGLARIHGKTRTGPGGTTSKDMLHELQDLRDMAMLKRAGMWRSSDPERMVALRRQQREEAGRKTALRKSLEKTAGLERPIDLNTASGKQLQRISGIGPATAKRIIAGRPYRTTRDLLKVRGIGPKKFEKIAPYVTVEGE